MLYPSGRAIKNEILSNKDLAETIYTNQLLENSRRDNLEGSDLGDIQLMSKFNKGIRFLLCAIDVNTHDVFL